MLKRGITLDTEFQKWSNGVRSLGAGLGVKVSDRFDLIQVVNKSIGETEKNLCKVFDATEQDGAILLFDEADALFCKRSEVEDRHDRYAKTEINYLLKRMEPFRRGAILTTNLKSKLDKAFPRHFHFVVQFPVAGSKIRKIVLNAALRLK